MFDSNKQQPTAVPEWSFTSCLEEHSNPTLTLHYMLYWMPTTKLKSMAFKPNAQAMDSGGFGSGIWKAIEETTDEEENKAIDHKNDNSAVQSQPVSSTSTFPSPVEKRMEEVKEYRPQPELHQILVRKVLDHEKNRQDAFEADGRTLEVFCNNHKDLAVGNCEVENPLLPCHGYERPDFVEESVDCFLNSTDVPTTFGQLQHSTRLSNMATIQNSSVHHLIDAGMIVSEQVFETEPEPITPLSEYLLGILAQIRKVMTEQSATCVELSEHSLYVLRGAVSRPLNEETRKNILLQPLLQGEKLFMRTTTSVMTLGEKLDEMMVSENPPPDLDTELTKCLTDAFGLLTREQIEEHEECCKSKHTNGNVPSLEKKFGDENLREIQPQNDDNSADTDATPQNKKVRFVVEESDDSDEEGCPSESDAQFVSGSDETDDSELYIPRPKKKKKRAKKTTTCSCNDDVLDSTDDDLDTEIPFYKINKTKLAELEEEGLKKFNLSLKDLHIDRKKVNPEVIFKLPDRISWREALSKSNNDEAKARLAMKENIEDRYLQKQARQAWESQRPYFGRYAKACVRNKHYSLENPKEKNVKKISARTLSHHFYNSQLESLAQFGKPKEGKEWLPKKLLRKRKSNTPLSQPCTKKNKDKSTADEQHSDGFESETSEEEENEDFTLRSLLRCLKLNRTDQDLSSSESQADLHNAEDTSDEEISPQGAKRIDNFVTNSDCESDAHSATDVDQKSENGNSAKDVFQQIKAPESNSDIIGINDHVQKSVAQCQQPKSPKSSVAVKKQATPFVSSLL